MRGDGVLSSPLLAASSATEEMDAVVARLQELGEIGPRPPHPTEDYTGMSEADRARLFAPIHAWQAEVSARLFGCELIVTIDAPQVVEPSEGDVYDDRAIYLAVAASCTHLSSEWHAEEASVAPTARPDWTGRLRACANLLGLEVGEASWTLVVW